MPDQDLDIKDFSIYFRVWDQRNWELSEKIEVVVNRNTMMKEVIDMIITHPANYSIKHPY